MKRTKAKQRKNPDLLQGTSFTFMGGSIAVLIQFPPYDHFATIETGLVGLGGPVDRFGIGEHEHSPLTTGTGSFFETLDKLTIKHGLPVSMAPVYLRYLRTEGDEVRMVTLQSAPHDGWVVVGFRMQSPPDFMVGAAIEVPEHEHWLASREPMPLSAALWIFRHITVEQLEQGLVTCACGPNGVGS